MFDIFAGLVLLVTTLPIMLLIALCLFVTIGKPLFSHERVGQNRRTFGCLKFRTMTVDAPRLLRLILRTNVNAANEWSVQQKLTNDPRVTRLGLFLRQTALDELPQLINVIRGEMSIVGPRPITESEIRRYKSDFAVYSSMKPGLTGLWQVYGRGHSSYAERVAYDRDYARRMSFGLDLWLILRSALVVIQRKGT
ncbi:MAG: sugar transferase [Rhodobacteraceae bacterium]|nr:sugar transferase [Paracoccaceae bacterium]